MLLLCWARWSNQGSPIRFTRSEVDGGDENVDDEETEVPAAIGERDTSRAVCGMMSHMDVAAKVRAIGQSYWGFEGASLFFL